MDYVEYIKEHFWYNPDGTITRDDRKGSNGSYDKDGYLIIKIKKRQFKAHRIVWLLNYGSFPNGEIDHINRNRRDNRIENLREATREMQIENREIKPNPKTGVPGIHIDTTKGLKARYAFSYKRKTYRFRTLEEAEEMKKCLKNS